MEKQYEDFNFFERLVDSFICFVEKKLYRKKWTYSEQLYKAMLRNQEDCAWLSANPVASMVSERNRLRLHKDWYYIGVEDISQFRSKVEAVEKSHEKL